MRARRRRSRLTFLFMAMTSLLIAFAIGFYVGGGAMMVSPPDRDVQTRLINKGGDPNHGNSCAPKGRYGKVKNPPKHCRETD